MSEQLKETQNLMSFSSNYYYCHTSVRNLFLHDRKEKRKGENKIKQKGKQGYDLF